jgi:hypothetical protein
MTEPSTPQDAVPAPHGTLHRQEQAPGTGARRSAPEEGALPGPRDANQPADVAPEGPSTAYEYRFGDRGAAATEHERQVRESLAGPSRDDTAHRK